MTPLDTPLTRVLDRQGRRRDWLAQQLGVRPWTFSRIEAGVCTAPPDWYARAAEILGVPEETINPRARTEVAA
jgi:hypothetical protein